MGRRPPENELHRIAETKHVHSKHAPYTGTASAGVTVDIYRAIDPKGVGVVLRITSTGDVGFLAHAKAIDGGIELHLAGDQAEQSLLNALHAAIGELRFADLISN